MAANRSDFINQAIHGILPHSNPRKVVYRAKSFAACCVVKHHSLPFLQGVSG